MVDPMEHYDVVVVGAGPAGYVSAIRASQFGLKTAVVDKEWLGGVCLNIGCIPSKALLKNADVAHTLRLRGDEFGFSFENLNLDYSAAVKRSRKISQRLARGVGFLMKKNNIDVFMGKASLMGQNQIAVESDAGKTVELTTKNIVIATGASPALLPGVNIVPDVVLSYREAILQETLPESIIIVGAGAIGVEFATIWNAYGADVTIIEMLPRLLPLEDEDVSSELQKSFVKHGIKVLTNYRVERVVPGENRVNIRINGPDGQIDLEAEQTLIAIGFKPNSKNINLEKVGVELTQTGGIQIDERMATNVPGIWAVGDVTAKLMLAHVGSAQGVICAENIAGIESRTLDYEMMPRATYCSPQVASFGLTEKQAQERFEHIKVSRFPAFANGKALGLGEATGWVKLITNAKTDEIVGAHLIGPDVTELLPELTLTRMMNLSAADIARNIHAHPTLSEMIMEAAHEATGHPLHL